MSRLADIVENKRRELAAMGPRNPSATRVALDVPSRLRRPAGAPLRLITEIKLRSPSAGPLSRALSPAERALVYAEASAAMISVLCDRPYFDGGWEHVEQVRASLDAARHAVPVLAKEFVLDERQIDEAKDRGADAVLLIVRIVSPERLTALVAHAFASGIEPLVEVAGDDELVFALATPARVIGVNARDLDTLAMDAVRAARILGAIPPDRVALHLSGIREPADAARVAATRADGALIGETLMRQDDPRPKLRALVDAASPKTRPAAHL
ncbi:MAG TPA: indole-3-glycerol-phosphate synthase [Polyangiaceae bacterium]|jgi:indole-3-glycerol phosphate synthase|nr:indole-3-glycerol-phosphate synthase [Polyangiaceae bacterium]